MRVTPMTPVWLLSAALVAHPLYAETVTTINVVRCMTTVLVQGGASLERSCPRSYTARSAGQHHRSYFDLAAVATAVRYRQLW
jgi:hypothetical protein